MVSYQLVRAASSSNMCLESDLSTTPRPRPRTAKLTTTSLCIARPFSHRSVVFSSLRHSPSHPIRFVWCRYCIGSPPALARVDLVTPTLCRVQV